MHAGPGRAAPPPPEAVKILHVNTEKTWRGGERQTLYTVQGLRALGLEVEALVRAGRPLAGRLAHVSGARVHAVRGSAGGVWFLARHGRSFDVIHAQTAKGQSLAVLALPFHRRPVIYTRRVDFVPHQTRVTRWKYRCTERLVCISEAIADIMREYGAQVDHVIPSAVCPRSLDPALAAELRERYRLHDRRVVGTVAAMVPHKDPLNLVNAFAEIANRVPDAVCLHFGDGELRGAVDRRVAELGLEDRYLRPGHVVPVEDYFALFDVFVMSSREEGLGSSVLDAFAYGVPVVSTDAGGLKETVTGRGLVCPKEESNALAEAVCRVLGDPEHAKRLAEAGQEAIRTGYSVAAMARSYLQVYRSLPRLSGELPPEPSRMSEGR